MPTFLNDGKTTTIFMFNHIVTHVGVPKVIVTNHGSHFQSTMVTKLSNNLGFNQLHFSPYYPQSNKEVKVVNKSLKIMLQRIVDKKMSHWHIILILTLWEYRNFIKIAIGFTPFQLVYGIESILPIECEIPSLKLVIQILLDRNELEKHIIYLEN